MSLFVIPKKAALKAEIFSNFLSDGWLVGGRGGGDALDKKPHPVKWLATGSLSIFQHGLVAFSY